jgi:prolyl-tRNA synthetase
MGRYSLDLGQTLVCLAEEHHDDQGLVWPIDVAPFAVHLVALGKTQDTAEPVYRQLEEAGFEVLYDDREESPGVKFTDADLIGAPFRVTIGARSLQAGGAELKLRNQPEKTMVPLDELAGRIETLVERLSTGTDG